VKSCPHCGVEIEATKGKPRSLDQHRRYIAMIKAAYLHWPETHSVQFSSDEECRKFLQMKAGHFEIAARIPLIGLNKERAKMLAEAAIRAAGSYAVPVVKGNDLVVFVPKSISFQRMTHLAFCALNDVVADVIKTETGIDADTLLNETERAA
jgi:4'-phosphopantetheinyl transferase EntD